MKKTWEVTEAFRPDRDYGVPISGTFAGRLSRLRKGRVTGIEEVAAVLQGSRMAARRTIALGARIGMLREVSEQSAFDEFCQLETVRYFGSQLRGSKYKHEGTNENGMSTRKTYLQKLFKFDRWLRGRRLSFQRHVRADADTVRIVSEDMTLGGVEDLLRAYRESRGADSAFVRMIKTFLLDDMHAGKKPSTVSMYYSAIRAYFDRNDSPIRSLRFDPGTAYDGAEDEGARMTLEDLMKILTVGRPTIMEKAVILAKFHRGLDNSTMADRFSYQAWEQLVEWFGTEDHARWDVAAKSPVPVRLTRIKTSYSHVGFLDIDAVDAIRDWLRIREGMTGSPMRAGEPMFIKNSRKAITDVWISALIRRLAKKAGIQERLADYKVAIRYKATSHEMRDLLKSTLIDSGCRYDVADHVIGHRPKDSYDKQSILYPESMRSEFAKASSRINIFSNMSRSMGGDREKEDLRRQVAELRSRLDEKESGSDAELREMRRDHAKIMEFIARQEGRA